MDRFIIDELLFCEFRHPSLVGMPLIKKRFVTAAAAEFVNLNIVGHLNVLDTELCWDATGKWVKYVLELVFLS